MSPEFDKKPDYASAVKYGGTKGQGRHPGSANDATTSVHTFMERQVQRWPLTMSLPPSPVLKARDIMENFQPIDSAGPFDDSREDAGHLLAPETISVNNGGSSGSLLHPKEGVIMDVTGYKTEDSDLNSDASDEHEAGMAGALNGRHRRKRAARRKRRGPVHGVNSQDNPVTETPSTTAHVLSSLDPRLPSRPTARPALRPKANNGLGTLPNRRSSSMPNLKDFIGKRSTMDYQTTRWVMMSKSRQ